MKTRNKVHGELKKMGEDKEMKGKTRSMEN